MIKISNEEISIKIGKKEHNFKNLILNELLNIYANSNNSADEPNTKASMMKERKKELRNLFIKFDTPITGYDETTKIKWTDFDILVYPEKIEEVVSSNSITKKYVWNEYVYEAIDAVEELVFVSHKWSDYIGKKICTLGFGYAENENSYISAILDVTNYDVYVESEEEIYITRIDKISTKALFTSDFVKGPIHLSGIIDDKYAKLDSVGFGNEIGKIIRYFPLVYEVNDNILTIKELYSSAGLYPNKNLYPSKGLFPDRKPYEYLILKYYIYKIIYNGANVMYEKTDEYYLQSIPLKNRRYINLKLKYER